MTHHHTTDGDVDLFGLPVPDLFTDPAPTPPPARMLAPGRVNNNTDDVQAVLRLAIREGYAVAGTREHIYRTPTRTTLDQISHHEADLVRQLLDTGWLTLGAARDFNHNPETITARTILVPRTSRNALSRWAGLKPLTGGRS